MRWEGDIPALRSPVLVAAFSGWNDAAERGDHRTRGDRGLTRRRADCRDRSGGVLRLPGHPADDPAQRGADARGGLAGELDPRRHRAECRARPRAAHPGSSRTCTGGASPRRSSRSPSASTSRWSSPSAPCSPTSPTRARSRSRACATDSELVERLGLSRSSYEGPTGIVGIIHDACRAAT